MTKSSIYISSLQRLIKISRPKFWHYLAGPYLLGMQWYLNNMFLGKVGIDGKLGLLIYGLFWFLLAGNLWVYGVNDWCDEDTDRLNAKKNDLDETLLKSSDKKALAIGLVLCVVSGLPLLALSLQSAVSWLLFLVISWGYSAEPVRAKSKPIIDSVFNILYVMPAVVSFGVWGEWLDWRVVMAGGLWCMAMHAFSAIPDIEPDSRVGLKTTAVLLGNHGTLIYCLFCYFLAAAITFEISNWGIIVGLLGIDALIMLILLGRPHADVGKFYRYFPALNLVMGLCLFIAIL